jgi:hypothetical protein
MQNSVWTTLLRRLPPDLHDILTLVTTGGIDINVQDLLRIEADHLVIRGRLAGTTDMGRIFFIPYDQISYVGFQKEVAVAQVLAIYGEPPAAEPAAPLSDTSIAAASPSEPPAATSVPAPPPAGAMLHPEPAKPGPQLNIPRKSRLLERLRARTNFGTNPRPPANP